MNLLRAFPVLAYAVVALGIVGVSAATGSDALLLVGGVLTAISWYVTEGPRGRSLPHWTANVLIVAVSLNALVELVQQRYDVVGVVGRFIVFMTLIKLYQHKTPRDYAQLLALSLLLMLLGALQSSDLLFAGVLLLYAVLGLHALLLFQLYAAHERTRAARLRAIPAGYRLLPSLQPIVGSRATLHLRSLVVAMAGAGLACSMVLFLLFPRGVGGGWIGGAGGSDSAQAGFNEAIDLTSSTRITDSRRVVLRLKITDGASRVSVPMRLRGAVLDRYSGQGRWISSSPSRRHQIDIQPPQLASLGTDTDRTEGTITQQFNVVSPTPTLFSVYVPVAVSTEDTPRVEYDARAQTLRNSGHGRLHRYAIRAVPNPSEATLQALAYRPWPVDGGHLVSQFAGFDAIADIGRRVLTEADLAPEPPELDADRWAWHAAAAAALEAYLQKSTEFDYETDLGDTRLDFAADRDRDPIVQFLTATKTGHCEYFASALAALCNCVGVPARLVTGYVAWEFDDRAGAFVVRDANAHAWVEVLVSPWRWQTFDPTPYTELRAIHSGRDAATDRWRWIFDRFQATWSDSIVGFDLNAQQRLLRTLDPGWTEKLNSLFSTARRWAATVNRAFNFGPAGYIWMGIVALALVIAVIAVGSRTRRAARLRATLHLRRGETPAYNRMLRQLGFYLDMLNVLQRAGSAKPRWQPPLKYADALAATRPESAELVREVTELFYAARYGGRRLDRDEVAHANALVEQLKGAMAHRPCGAEGRYVSYPA